MTVLRKPHNEFRLEFITPVDVRAVGWDPLLTQLWLRILLDNRVPVRRTVPLKTIADLAQEMNNSDAAVFSDFDLGAAEAWLRADLVRPLKRDPTQYSVARPLHAEAIRLRSTTKHSDDSNASLAVYGWLWHEDKGVLKDLRKLIASSDGGDSDIVTLALSLLGDRYAPDLAAKPNDEVPVPPRPLSSKRARLYADDVRRLIAYRDKMPRMSLIAHLQRLTGFHLGLDLLTISEIVTHVDDHGTAPAEDPILDLVVDFGEDRGTEMAKLAERSWQVRDETLQRYVQAHMALKKLHQYAEAAHKRGVAMPESIDELASSEREGDRPRFDAYFEAQMDSLLQDNAKDKDNLTELERLVDEYRSLGMSPFRTYHGLLVALKANNWVGYHRQLLDSLMAKNTANGMLRQPLGGRSRRRAAMGAGLLETLTLVALVQRSNGKFHTQPLRVDELITHLERRYGLCIATSPVALQNDFEVARVLASNVDRFKARLRETGLFKDLSDAFVAQLVRPRFTVA